MADKKITIKDIAKLAEVSAGTVDRVLHNRGKVSEDKRKKVEAVLKEINYEPNLIAKTLKNNRIFRLAAILPTSDEDEYWQKAKRGLQAALAEFRSFGISLDLCQFDITDPGSFQEACREVLNSGADGIIAVPFFHAEAPQEFAAFEAQEIPYITFNTHLNGLSPQCSIGQNLKQSGTLAAQLALMSRKKPGSLAMIHVNEHPDNADHAREKEEGFKAYLNANQINHSSFHSISLDENRNFEQELQKALESIPDLSAVHVSTSKAFLICEILKKIHPDCILSGYDLVHQNVALLRAGQIQFLIDQKPMEQAYQGVARFTDQLIFKKPIESKYLLPLHVAFKENIDSLTAAVPVEKIA